MVDMWKFSRENAPSSNASDLEVAVVSFSPASNRGFPPKSSQVFSVNSVTSVVKILAGSAHHSIDFQLSGRNQQTLPSGVSWASSSAVRQKALTTEITEGSIAGLRNAARAPMQACLSDKQRMAAIKS
jgi:hypothetical protein